MTRHYSDAKLERLRDLRSRFLAFEDAAGAAAPVYWDSPLDLQLYDEVYGERVGWKWDAVLGELSARGRLPGGETLVDWGCGTGVAVRRFLAAGGRASRVGLVDHSEPARAFAAARLGEEHPSVTVEATVPDAPDVLLVSHVLDELDAAGLEDLLALAARSAAVIWVEPGSRRTSQRLGALRARLAEGKDVLAPCTHQAACGALVPGHRGWCHFFARVSQDVYTRGRWAELGRELGIDLRSLPYSFLALAREGTFPLDGPAARILARPRISRGRAEFQLCDAEGVHSADTLQRFDKALHRDLERSYDEPWLVDVEREGTRVTRLERRSR